MDFFFPRNFRNGFQLSLWVQESGGSEGDLNGLLGPLSPIVTRLRVVTSPFFCLFLLLGCTAQVFPEMLGGFHQWWILSKP